MRHRIEHSGVVTSDVIGRSMKATEDLLRRTKRLCCAEAVGDVIPELLAYPDGDVGIFWPGYGIDEEDRQDNYETFNMMLVSNPWIARHEWID